jgi:hypothetical protein
MAKNDIGLLATKKQLSLANYTDRLAHSHHYKKNPATLCLLTGALLIV